ncbi:sugar (and other) transporter family protein [Mycobacterium kansasii 732]|nr:sugar (and other) transporter family protein [Mycobacterium kansasii 732]
MIPALEAARGTALAEAGLLSAMPSLGMVVALIAWGYVADRIGERRVLATGSALTAVSAFAAASVNSLVAMGALLFLGGMAAASCNPACGRVVAGWFPAHQRGLAMGVRQTAQPLGIAMGALVIPQLAEHRPSLGLLFPASACAVSAVVDALIAHDPPRKPRTAAADAELVNPYRGSAVLWRIHAISALMVMPAVDDGDLHAGLVDRQPRVVGASCRCAGDHHSTTRCVDPHCGRQLVRLCGIAHAPGPHRRARHQRHVTHAVFGQSARFAACGGVHGHGLGDHGDGQRARGHCDHRIRPTILEWARAGRSEHDPAADDLGRPAGIRSDDHGRRISIGARIVWAVPTVRGTLGARRPAPARCGGPRSRTFPRPTSTETSSSP